MSLPGHVNSSMAIFVVINSSLEFKAKLIIINSLLCEVLHLESNQRFHSVNCKHGDLLCENFVWIQIKPFGQKTSYLHVFECLSENFPEDEDGQCSLIKEETGQFVSEYSSISWKLGNFIPISCHHDIYWSPLFLTSFGPY